MWPVLSPSTSVRRPASPTILLTRGASKVYAVDVGTNQLAWKLRQDRASAMPASISFPRSLKRLILGKPGAKLVALICNSRLAGKKSARPAWSGIQSSMSASAQAKGWVESQGWTVLGVTQSPITGPEGNVEFLLGAEKNG